MKQRKNIVIAMLMIATIFISGCSFFGGNTPKSPVSTELTTSEKEARILEIAEDYPAAVVTIIIVDAQGTQRSLGSGVGIYQGGFIATNYHVVFGVIQNATYSLNVYYNNSVIAYSAELLWYDSNLDVAVIKSENESLPFIEMQDRTIFPESTKELKALETVIAIGTPLDYSLQNTVTLGEVSSKNLRVSKADGNIYQHLIQHTAPINHGNSGGALIDINGKLIGLNTLGNDDANSLFYAVSVYPLTLVIDDIVKNYNQSTVFSSPKMGVSLQDRYMSFDSGGSFSEKGVIIDSVDTQSYVFNVIFKSDVITKIKVGAKTFEINLRNDFIYAMLNAEKGQVVTLTLTRAFQTMTISVNLMLI